MIFKKTKKAQVFGFTVDIIAFIIFVVVTVLLFFVVKGLAHSQTLETTSRFQDTKTNYMLIQLLRTPISDKTTFLDLVLTRDNTICNVFNELLPKNYTLYIDYGDKNTMVCNDIGLIDEIHSESNIDINYLDKKIGITLFSKKEMQ